MKHKFTALIVVLLLVGCSEDAEKNASVEQSELSGENKQPQAKLIVTAEWKGILSGYHSKVSYYDNGESKYE